MRLLLFLIITSSFSSYSQNTGYWVKFTDKFNSSYSVGEPLEFLSQKSIDRRAKSGISIVENDLPVNKQYIDSVLNVASGELIGKSKWFNAIVVSLSDTNFLSIIESISFVESVVKVKSAKQNIVASKYDKVITNKNNIDLYNIPHYPYGYSYNQLALHGANKLQDMGFRGQGVHIAIIDAGFFKANELLGLNEVFNEGRILSTYDFVDNEESVYEDHYHGAMVLSIIGGSIDGAFKGSAPKASFHLLRSEDANSETILEEYNWISAAEYADSAGVDIINTSLGYTIFDDSLQNHSYSDFDGNTTIISLAADIAASKGILLCTSAGNSGASAWQYISTPADADSTITVAAADSNGVRAFFSSVGPASDGDVKPNVASVGWNTYLISPFSGEIIQGNGTSFSSPMMAGMVACLWQALPEKNNMEIKQLVEVNSSQYDFPDSLIGYGIPNFYAAYSEESGAIYMTPTESLIEDVFPNPIKDFVNVIYISEKNQGIHVKLYSEKGEIIIARSEVVLVGKNKLVLTLLSSLDSGVYILEIESENGQKSTSKLSVI